MITMKSNIKSIAKFGAVLLALLSIGMHSGAIVIPMLSGYKFSMLGIAFLLLLGSMIA